MSSLNSELTESTLGDASREELRHRLGEASRTAMPLFNLLGRTGTLEILYDVGRQGPIRFTELQTGIGVSSATLSARLSELVDAGLIERTSYDENPPRVEYTPTQRLLDLKPAFYDILAWTAHHGIEKTDELADRS
jgi:DNA-binding HxlR family transcriptional regulator